MVEATAVVPEGRISEHDMVSDPLRELVLKSSVYQRLTTRRDSGKIAISRQ